MEDKKKLAMGITLLLILVVGVRTLLLIRERKAEENAPAAKAGPVIPTDPDYLVFLKQKRPSAPKDEKELIGQTIWVSAGGQIDYYPYIGHKVDYAHKAGTLLGAEPLKIAGVVEQVAPKQDKSATFRVPGGDRQVLLTFTLPKSAQPTTEYAAPVGYHEAGQYTFFTDQIFFYEDPHQLYAHWSPEIWAAIDRHEAIKGMSEREVQMALGQVSVPGGGDEGDRAVTYDNLGHPFDVTFQKGKAVRIDAAK